MDSDKSVETKRRYKNFLKERRWIVDDIKQFLIMVLAYFLDMEEKCGHERVVKANEKSVKSLIKSLCLIHALYGYPADTDDSERLKFNARIEDIIYDIAKNADKSGKVLSLTASAKNLLQNNVISKNAVKDILLNKIKMKNKEDATVEFAHYYEEVKKDEFWQFEFGESVNSLPREPAHIFLQVGRFVKLKSEDEGPNHVTRIRADQPTVILGDGPVGYLVRAMFPDGHKQASTIGREFLKTLPENNWLKPVVWAEHKTKKECYGVSLGVRSFVRPLYLFIKLNQLETKVEDYKLKDVRAFQIAFRNKNIEKTENTVNLKDPCVSCQNFFGFMTCAPIGNCAEYDVIGNVNPGLLGTDQWEKFNDACKQHIIAFKKMLSMVTMVENQQPSSEGIIGTYFKNTRSAEKPNVLNYEWNSESKAYKLINKY